METKRFPIFADRLATLRGKMTQAEFADFLEISRATLGFYENGTRIPDILALRKISQKCNVSSDWLLGITDVKNYDMTLQAICDYTGLTPDAVQILNVASQNPKNDCTFIMLESVIRSSMHLYGDFARLAAHLGCSGEKPSGGIGPVMFAGESISEWFERLKSDPCSSSLADGVQSKLFHTMAIKTVQEAAEYALNEYENQVSAASRALHEPKGAKT